MGIGSAEVTRLPAVAEDGFPPVSWYGVTFFRGNDDLKVVSVIFVPMTVGVFDIPVRGLRGGVDVRGYA